MRTPFWVPKAILILAAATASLLPAQPKSTQAIVELDGGTKMAATMRPGLSYLTVEKKPGRVPLWRDKTVGPKTGLEKLALVGQAEGVLIVTDTYASLPGSMSYCKAGEEQFLRILTWGGKSGALRESLKLKIQSCRQSIELASDGVSFDPVARVLQLNWSSGPSVKGQKEAVRYRIGANGKVERLAPTAN